MRIAIAGGTGTVGRHVVAAAAAAGHETVVLSRATGVDLMSDADGAHATLAASIAGCDVVIDVTSTASLAQKVALSFFGTVTERLLAAEVAAGVGHHVVLSVVGAAEVDAGYYAGKALQERLVAASSVGWSILPATQFHEFAAQMAARPRVAGIRLVPNMLSRPIAAAEVAAELVDIASGAPRGRTADLGGPRIERMAELVRRYVGATGLRGPVLEVTMPGAMGAAMKAGRILPGADARLGRQTFDEWLEAEVATRAR